jgi:hypothetical protein
MDHHGAGNICSGAYLCSNYYPVGYFSAMTAVESQHHLVDATTAKYAVIFQQSPSKIDATSDKLASDLTDRSDGLRKVAVGAGVLSLLAFITGCRNFRVAAGLLPTLTAPTTPPPAPRRRRQKPEG